MEGGDWKTKKNVDRQAMGGGDGCELGLPGWKREKVPCRKW